VDVDGVEWMGQTANQQTENSKPNEKPNQTEPNQVK